MKDKENLKQQNANPPVEQQTVTPLLTAVQSSMPYQAENVTSLTAIPAMGLSQAETTNFAAAMSINAADGLPVSGTPDVPALPYSDRKHPLPKLTNPS